MQRTATTPSRWARHGHDAWSDPQPAPRTCVARKRVRCRRTAGPPASPPLGARRRDTRRAVARNGCAPDARQSRSPGTSTPIRRCGLRPQRPRPPRSTGPTPSPRRSGTVRPSTRTDPPCSGHSRRQTRDVAYMIVTFTRFRPDPWNRPVPLVAPLDPTFNGVGNSNERGAALSAGAARSWSVRAVLASAFTGVRMVPHGRRVPIVAP